MFRNGQSLRKKPQIRRCRIEPLEPAACSAGAGSRGTQIATGSSTVSISWTWRHTGSDTGTPPIAGDVNGDGVVNGLDIALVASNWLQKAGPLTVTAPADTQSVNAGGTLAVNGVALSDPYLPTTDNVTLTLAVANGAVALSTALSGGIGSIQITGNGTASATIVAALGRDQCHAG